MNMLANQNTDKSAYAQVLGHAPFRSLWFGQICSQLAINTLLFVLALRIYQTTTSNTAVSGLFLAHGIPAVLFGLIAGTIVDRLDKRKILILCDVLRGALVFILLFLSHNIAIVYAITFLNSVISQLYVPSEAPLIPKLVPKEYLVSANSMFSFTFYSSLALGSILAGPLLRWFGPQGIFFFISGLFVAAAWFSSRIPSQSRGTAGFAYIQTLSFGYLLGRIWTRLTEGVRYVSSTKTLFDAIMLLTGTQIILVILGSLGPGFADRVLRIDIRDASLLIVGPAVLGILMGAVWIGSVGYRYRQSHLVKAGILGAGISLLAIALTVHLLRLPSFSWIVGTTGLLIVEILLFFFLGVANSLLDVPSNASLQKEAKGPMRGRVYGILAAFVGGVGVLPVFLGGALADVMGVGKVIFAMGVVITVYGVYRLRYTT